MPDADNRPLIYWYRRDLRFRDLPGLTAAAATGHPVLACYIHSEGGGDLRPAGGASRWWLHHSLAALRTQLVAVGGDLVLRSGPPVDALLQLAQDTRARGIYFSRVYEPGAQACEQALHRRGGDAGLEVKRYPGGLLFEAGAGE